MQVQQDELITGGAGGDGSTVDMQDVEDAFGKGEVKAASVKDELDDLMQDFQGGKTPAWAAGAMRNANAAMAARGLSASSQWQVWRWYKLLWKQHYLSHKQMHLTNNRWLC